MLREEAVRTVPAQEPLGLVAEVHVSSAKKNFSSKSGGRGSK